MGGQTDATAGYLPCRARRGHGHRRGDWHSPQKEAKEKQIIQRRLEKFEKALTDLSQGLSQKRTTKKVDKVRKSKE
jgi:hypothetical protein